MPCLRAVVGDQFVLFDLRKAVGIATQFRSDLRWTIFIEKAGSRMIFVRVDRQTNLHSQTAAKTRESTPPPKVSSSNDGVQKRIGKGLCSGPRSQVVDNGNTFGRCDAIFARKQVSSNILIAVP